MNLLPYAFDPLLDLFCPTDCAGCDAARGPLCPECEVALRSLPLRASPPAGLRPLTIWLGDYEGPLRGLIRASKFRRSGFHGRWLSHRMGELLAGRPGLLATTDALVLPPVEPTRQPYHPAWSLAQELGARFRLPVLPHVLRRQGNARVRHLARRARGEHATSTLHPDRAVPTGVRRVALVDDLWTTGATARRVATVLARQGVEVVMWVFLARTPRRRRHPSRIPEVREPLKIALQAGRFA
jgi:predicted amidophosphoribosyltransferase